MFFVLNILLFSNMAVTQEEIVPKDKVIVKYRDSETFDLDELSVEGDGSTPGDLSVSDRFRNEFRNKLPHRYNFNPEIRSAVEAIR